MSKASFSISTKFLLKKIEPLETLICNAGMTILYIASSIPGIIKACFGTISHTLYVVSSEYLFFLSSSNLLKIV